MFLCAIHESSSCVIPLVTLSWNGRSHADREEPAAFVLKMSAWICCAYHQSSGQRLGGHEIKADQKMAQGLQMEQAELQIGGRMSLIHFLK